MDLVTGAMANIIMKLGKLLNDEVKLQRGMRKKIQTLTRDLESMHVALRKVAEVPPNQLDEEVKLWARDVRELSYNVDDILDTFLVCVDSRDEDPGPNKLKRATKKIGKLFNKSKAHHKIACMIKTINEKGGEVAERHRRYRADDIVAKIATTSTLDPRLTALYREASQIIGVEKSSAPGAQVYGRIPLLDAAASTSPADAPLQSPSLECEDRTSREGVWSPGL